MNTVKTVRELRAAVARARSEGKRIALVPTMGNLHSGHTALVTKAAQRADFVVASIFVNPLQFGPNEDLATYPRTLAADQEKLLQAGCHLLFTPTVEEMYPHGMADQTIVRVPVVSEGLCGGSRPGHFDGVSTVVSKLFNMVGADRAYFGQKDAQQLHVVRAMVRDLDIDVEVVAVPTVRESDGMALSSRNVRLPAADRTRAVEISRALNAALVEYRAGTRRSAHLLSVAGKVLASAGIAPEYLAVVDQATFAPVEQLAEPSLIIVAARGMAPVYSGPGSAMP